MCRSDRRHCPCHAAAHRANGAEQDSSVPSIKPRSHSQICARAHNRQHARDLALRLVLPAMQTPDPANHVHGDHSSSSAAQKCSRVGCSPGSVLGRHYLRKWLSFRSAPTPASTGQDSCRRAAKIVDAGQAARSGRTWQPLVRKVHPRPCGGLFDPGHFKAPVGQRRLAGLRHASPPVLGRPC